MVSLVLSCSMLLWSIDAFVVGILIVIVVDVVAFVVCLAFVVFLSCFLF